MPFLSNQLMRTSAALVCAPIALFIASASAASVTGVCPDGSIFIVQHIESVPCRDAKTVDPADVPPLKPEFLPRPYGWEVFNRRNDPNNPYNLIQERRRPAGNRTPARAEQRRRLPEDLPEVRVRSRGEFVEEPMAPTPSTPLGLADAEVRDLSMIVDLSQRRAPAAIWVPESGGRVRLARSRAFETRLQQRFADRGNPQRGPILLFSADTQDTGSFYGNLTFVQGQYAYQPNRDDPRQMGLIHGHLGELVAGDSVLGYVVLPERINVSNPMDIYWNDRQITATLTP